jgi:hypothetical protein
MDEKILLPPSPELADILVGFDNPVPELQPVFGALGTAAPDGRALFYRGFRRTTALAAQLNDYFLFGGTMGSSR